jgi:hypothetical protein
MRFLLALILSLGACADYSAAPPPLDAAVALDQAPEGSDASPDGMSLNVDAGTGLDAAHDLFTPDLAPRDLAGSDLKTTCVTVSCTQGALGDALCKTSCATLTATCGGNPAHCNP